MLCTCLGGVCGYATQRTCEEKAQNLEEATQSFGVYCCAYLLDCTCTCITVPDADITHVLLFYRRCQYYLLTTANQ